MSLNIPDSPAPNGYQTRPAEYTAAIEKAHALFKEQLADTSGWEELPDKEDVKLARKATSDDPYDIPLVKGTSIVEATTPQQVLASIQLPGIRKKWDARFESGSAIARYGVHSYEFYSVMKSPSYFIWARDIVGVQENFYADDLSNISVLQVSVTDDENLPEAGSYQKSRTRATVDVSGWQIKQVGDDVELTYIVKVHLNGAIPTSVVSTIAAETPLCVARVRDVHYTLGFHPYDVEHKAQSKTVHVVQFFEDDKDERTWTGVYVGGGVDEKIKLAYDGKRMYAGGVSVNVTGAGAGDVTATPDESAHTVTIDVTAAAKDKEFKV